MSKWSRLKKRNVPDKENRTPLLLAFLLIWWWKLLRVEMFGWKRRRRRRSRLVWSLCFSDRQSCLCSWLDRTKRKKKTKKKENGWPASVDCFWFETTQVSLTNHFQVCLFFHHFDGWKFGCNSIVLFLLWLHTNDQKNLLETPECLVFVIWEYLDVWESKESPERKV